MSDPHDYGYHQQRINAYMEAIVAGTAVTVELRTQVKQSLDALREEREKRVAKLRATVVKQNRNTNKSLVGQHAPVHLWIGDDFRMLVSEKADRDIYADRLAACWNHCRDKDMIELLMDSEKKASPQEGT